VARNFGGGGATGAAQGSISHTATRMRVICALILLLFISSVY